MARISACAPLRRDRTCFLNGRPPARWRLLRGTRELAHGVMEDWHEPVRGVEWTDRGRPARALELRLAEVQEQLRATSDILKVLTSSSSEQTRVFDAVVDNARRLLDAAGGADLPRRRASTTCWRGRAGCTEEFVDFVDRHPITRDRGTLVGRVTMDRTVHRIKRRARRPGVRPQRLPADGWLPVDDGRPHGRRRPGRREPSTCGGRRSTRSTTRRGPARHLRRAGGPGPAARRSSSPPSRAGRRSWRARSTSSRRSPRWARRSARRSWPTRC